MTLKDQRVMPQNEFWTWATTVGGANDDQLQIANPSGSGKILIVTSILFLFKQATDEWQVRFNKGSSITGATTINAMNKYIGGAAASAVINVANTTEAPGTFAFDIEPGVGGDNSSSPATYHGAVMVDLCARGNKFYIDEAKDIIFKNKTNTNPTTCGIHWKEISA